ncbi:putative pectinesterase 55, partial [Bienertia sinuspersici]
NTYNKALENRGRNPIAQAIAFGSFGEKHALYSCGFIGYQDTIWDAQCAINVTGDGFITAQGRLAANDTGGYVFRGCDIFGIGHAFLGRAHYAFSRVIFIDSKFSNAVKPKGWFIWKQTGHEKDITYAEVNCTGPGADTSKRVSWEKKLDSSEVKQYTTQAFIDQDGWIAKLPM